VSKVFGVGSQRSVGLPEVILGIEVVVSAQSTQLVLVAVGHRDGMRECPRPLIMTTDR
jgi:hypothetical protein